MDYKEILAAHGVDTSNDEALQQIITMAACNMVANKHKGKQGRKFIQSAINNAISKYG